MGIQSTIRIIREKRGGRTYWNVSRLETLEKGGGRWKALLLRHRRVCVCIARYHRQLLCTSPNASVAIVILLLFPFSSSSSWSFICVATCMNGTNNEQDLRLELAGNSDSKDISFSQLYIYIYSTFTSVMYSRRWAHSRQWPTTVKAATACCSVTVLCISGKDIQSFRKTAFQLAIGLLRLFFFFLVVVVVDPPTVS